MVFLIHQLVCGHMQSRGKTEEDVAKLLDAGVYDMQKLLDGGWVTGLKYADEVQVMCSTPAPSLAPLPM